MSDTEYRYVAARGVEFRDEGFMSWARVPDTILAEMTAAELRKVADAMDGGDVERISAELSGGVWEAEAKQFKLELDEARAQLAALTTPNATPLGWVNVRNGEVSRMWPTKQAASTNAKTEHDRIAVPVYEHPAPVAAAVTITDAEIAEIAYKAWKACEVGGDAFHDIARALRPLFDRAAQHVAPQVPTKPAEAMQVVGACVVGSENRGIVTCCNEIQARNESDALRWTREHGGTPCILYAVPMDVQSGEGKS